MVVVDMAVVVVVVLVVVVDVVAGPPKQVQSGSQFPGQAASSIP